MNNLFFIFSLAIVTVLSLGLQPTDAVECIDPHCCAQIGQSENAFVYNVHLTAVQF